MSARLVRNPCSVPQARIFMVEILQNQDKCFPNHLSTAETMLYTCVVCMQSRLLREASYNFEQCLAIFQSDAKASIEQR